MLTSDLGLWYEWYAETGCPNCGINMRKLHPEANLFPHFTGACKTPVSIEQERSWEQPARRTRQDSLVKWGCVFLAVAILLVLGLVATSHSQDSSYPPPGASNAVSFTPYAWHLIETHCVAVLTEAHIEKRPLTSSGDPLFEIDGQGSQIVHVPEQTLKLRCK